MLRLILTLIPVAVVFLLAFLLGRHNDTQVMVDWLFVTQQTSLAVVLALTLSVGFVLGLLTLIVGYLRLKWQNQRLRKALVKASTRVPQKDV
ncbi:MAG: LapA family protein [Aliidiomarina sp.]|uniref:LapA family protein n=1 Tax=Aliidiomarina sp. TaxID=1872439 RepID=UPI0025C2C893|nr:LapA family protein [Aliidiomarina sp.]MCH8500334.1 LapA family protein [Aliidiomarina sp.]